MTATAAQTEWERLVPAGSSLVICGAGNLCQQLFEQFPQGLPSHEIVAVGDNDPVKWGCFILPRVQVSTRSIECAVDEFKDEAIYAILIHLGAEDVRQQLIGLGVSPDRIVHWWTLWQHFDTLKVPAWADVPPHPENWLDVWSDEASRQVVRDAYDFFKTYSDRTAVYEPREAYSLPENIYFDETVYRRLDDERFLDGGAYDGDTVRAFLSAYGDKHGRVIAVEASPANYAKLLSWSPDGIDIICINDALVDNPLIPKVKIDGNGVSARIGDDGISVPAGTIDGMCKFFHFSPTLIKLDIEGAELDALRGAVETIKRDRPVIACCLYHHPRDLWEIPAFLADVCEGYRFYARCYEDMGWETVAYAVPKERCVNAA